jgi:hypothetical protein
MKTFICFGKFGDFCARSETLVGAIQAAIAARGGVARDWQAHDLATYPAHLRARLLREVGT